jgi:site-specific recombinase XerD
MNEVVELYRKELAEVSGFKDNTVGIYVTSIYRYLDYAQKIRICDPIRPRAEELNTWIAHLKETEVSLSRLRNYQVALRSFFTFVRKMGIIDCNPADYLFPIRRAQSMKNQPISTEMYNKGVPAEDIRRMMGHDSIEETSLYIHVSDELKKEALEKITIPGR